MRDLCGVLYGFMQKITTIQEKHIKYIGKNERKGYNV